MKNPASAGFFMADVCRELRECGVEIKSLRCLRQGKHFLCFP